MGNCITQRYELVDREICNYNCSTCMTSGKIPNLLGKFFIINDKECKCNGCNTIYDKESIYKKVVI